MRALLLTALLSPAVFAETLSIERIYSDPSLSGRTPIQLKIAPDGSRVSFLRGKPDNQFELDLWSYSIASNTTERLVDSRELLGGKTETLTAEERARRERQRTAALSGIVDYFWSADAQQLVFPLSGELYLWRLKPTGPVRGIDALRARSAEKLATGGGATDPKFSPDGRTVSFVRAQNLYLTQALGSAPVAVSNGGGGTLSFGMAEFIAQEEMDRDTGYWWSPDSRAIAYARVEESPVPIERRFEIYADRTEVIEQRYPAAGKPNARVSLEIRRVDGLNPPGPIMAVNLGDDIYLARVDWLADSSGLLVQRQTRDQRLLELLHIDLKTLKQRLVLSERSETWVNLHHDLNLLKKQPALVWSSERSGFRQLELVGLDGKRRHALTRGNYVVDQVLAVDENLGFVYFSANASSPIEKQIYRVKLDGSTADKPERLTRNQPWNEASFAKDASLFVATESAATVPPQVRVYRANGERIADLEPNVVGSEHPYFPYVSNDRAPEFGTLRTAGDVTLHYRLIKPQNFDASKRYPVLIYTYGGPHVQVVQNRWDPRWGLILKYFAQTGFLVFSVDNRGSDRRGTAFENPIFRAMGGVEIDDQLAGVEWLKRQSFVDPKRIAIFGWSYGGYMSLKALAHHSDAFAAGVSVAPVTDWALYDTHYTERYMDHPSANAAGYTEASVLAHAKGITSPLLLIHGMADDNVLFTHSTQLMALLQTQGTQFDLQTYPGGKHGLSGKPSQVHVFTAIDRFLREKLSVGAP
jgi:dipeptidyl-peptidase 4